MTTDEGGPAPAALDQELLLAEIYAEVDRRRASGELPGELEAELDRAFAEVSPAGATGDDTALLLERVQRTSFIEPRVPLEHLRPPRSQVKRVLFKLMAWYVHFVTDQVTEFGQAVTTALRSHDERISDLERGGGQLPTRLRAELERVEDRPLPEALIDDAVHALAAVEGRILVAESGSGTLLRRLRSAGRDAYGAEPRRGQLPAVLRDGLEVRAASGSEHLRQLPDGRLGAVVLAGSAVERSVAVAAAELVGEAARAVAPGAPVLVLSPSVEAWAGHDAGPVADLAPGRPLRPATWAHLGRGAGLVVDGTIEAAASRPLPAPDPTAPGGEVLADLVDRLGPVLAPSPAYLVQLRRPS